MASQPELGWPWEGRGLRDRASLAGRLRLMLPTGRTLPDDAWLHRHHAMIGLLVAESLALTLFSVAEGNGFVHSAAHAVLLIPIGLAALLLESRRRAASVL